MVITVQRAGGDEFVSNVSVSCRLCYVASGNYRCRYRYFSAPELNSNVPVVE
jgi:hypothetical protein